MLHLPILFLTTVNAVWDAEVGDIGNYGTAAELGQHLDFVERNVLNLLQLGSFPQLYNSSYPKIEGCGCYYSPVKITFGTSVGLECQRRHDIPKLNYDEENCGIICNNPHAMDIVLFCPYGWDSDCSRGCFPPDEFKNVGERIDFWELTLTSLLMHGSEYITVLPEYLDSCGCEGKIRPVRYGTQVGFDCVLGEGKLEKIGEACAGHSACLDSNGRQIMTFCPAGHRATCAGCEKVIEGDDFRSRLQWMMNVVTGYARESLEVLGWTPTIQQLIDCSCARGVQKVSYGSNLGYFCEVRNVNDITQDCGPNVLCDAQGGKQVLHFCPAGFKASCSEGCVFPWKDEL